MIVRLTTAARPLGSALAAAGLALALSSAPAEAQLSSNGGPIAYSADNLEYVDGARQLILTGNVEVAQDTSTLRADKLTLYFASSARPDPTQGGFGAGDIERIVASGDVFFVRPEQTARGDNAVYELKTDSVTFTGRVVVASDENVVKGESMVLEIGSRRTTVKPGAGPGQRVRGVFRTRSTAPNP
ncbi:MAG: OstA family protein [Alphaproteobacteria bacterium]|nr:OstA family protein [Alphaproteobacteria bacterium]